MSIIDDEDCAKKQGNTLSSPLVCLPSSSFSLTPSFFYQRIFFLSHKDSKQRWSAGTSRITMNDNEHLRLVSPGTAKKRAALGIPQTWFAVATFHRMPIECGLRCSRFHGIVLRIARPTRPWRSSSHVPDSYGMFSTINIEVTGVRTGTFYYPGSNIAWLALRE